MVVLAVPPPALVELTTAWAVAAAYTHMWDPAWKSTLWGNYEAVSYNSTRMRCCARIGAGTGRPLSFGCDNDWAAWGVGLRTEWAVSNSFQMGVEVMYQALQSATTGALNGLPSNITPSTLTCCKWLVPTRSATRTTGPSACGQPHLLSVIG